MAAWESILRETSGSLQTATERGFRQHSKAIRQAQRCQVAYGAGQALSAYIWMRTERGPQRKWLFTIGKDEDSHCQCSATAQSSNHITFDCPRHHRQRVELLQGRRTWEELDEPTRVQVEENKYENGVMFVLVPRLWIRYRHVVLSVPFRTAHLILFYFICFSFFTTFYSSSLRFCSFSLAHYPLS